MRIKWRIHATPSMVLLVLIMLSLPAQAAVITVNSIVDDTLVNDDSCTLREAINNANTDSDTTSGDCVAGSGPDTITLPGAVLVLTISGAGEDANASGDLDISSDITINGAGAKATVIDGNSSDRVFHILSGTVVFNDLMVRNGRSTDGEQGFDCDYDFCFEEAESGAPGGGIYNQGNLTLNRVSVTGNQSGHGGDAGDVDCPEDDTSCETIAGEGGSGGGVYNTATLTINQGLFANNRTGNGGQAGSEVCGGGEFSICYSAKGDGGDGGGVAGGVLVITDSTFTGNTAYNAGAISQGDSLNLADSRLNGNLAANAGGALLCENNTQVCTISGSTFYGNRSSGSFGGGAIAFFNNGVRTISNSTVSGNISTSSGGGILAWGGPVNMQFVTLVNNITISGDGGGIFRLGASVNVGNSIIANNRDIGGQAPDCSGVVYSLGFNLLENLTGCSFGSQATDKTNLDPGLRPLADNGGPTPTHALLLDSPALDMGYSAGQPVDQRGLSRPFDIPGIPVSPGRPVEVSNNADIGAVEMHAIIVTNADDSGVGSLRQALLDANATGIGYDDILFDQTFFSTPRTINLLSALPDLQSGLKLYGPGSNMLTVHRASGGEFQIFYTTSLSIPSLAFSGLTISNGIAVGEFGGGISVRSDLSLLDVAVVDSEATGSVAGGGVSLSSGSGVFINSTFSNNTASRGGGIVFWGNNGETLRLVNCTLSGNNGGDGGGGIRHVGSSGVSTLEVFSSTFADNSATSGAAINTEVFSAANDPVTTVSNSIFSGNASPQLGTLVSAGTATVTSLGYNLSSDNGSGFLNAVGDQIDTDPLLGPLTLSAGRTKTHVPMNGSPAHDTGSCEASKVYRGQRGFLRPVDLPSTPNTADGCDIGSVEWTGDANGDGFEDGVVYFSNGFE